MTEKAMTLRLSEDLAADLDIVAAVDGSPRSDAIRAAILAHIETRRADPEFQAKAAEMTARLSRLAVPSERSTT